LIDRCQLSIAKNALQFDNIITAQTVAALSTPSELILCLACGNIHRIDFHECLHKLSYQFASQFYNELADFEIFKPFSYDYYLSYLTTILSISQIVYDYRPNSEKNITKHFKMYPWMLMMDNFEKVYKYKFDRIPHQFKYSFKKRLLSHKTGIQEWIQKYKEIYKHSINPETLDW
jgi:hypothetical protein